MVREEVKKIFGLIASVYPNFIPSEKEQAREKLDVWHDFLKDQNASFVESKVKSHIAKERFPPTISEIIDHSPKQEASFIDKLEGMRRDAASPEVAAHHMAKIREMLYG